MDRFEEKLKTCIENLKNKEYQAATDNLFPIAKGASALAYFSECDAEKFAHLMCDVISMLSGIIQIDTKGMGDYRHLITDAYRTLRNSCANSPKVQETYGGSKGPQLMRCTREIAEGVRMELRGEAQIQGLAVIIQFLHNLCQGQEKNQDLVWDHFTPQIKTWLALPEGRTELDRELGVKIINSACAVVEACLPRQWKRNEQFLQDGITREIVMAVFVATENFTFEYNKKVMIKLVQVPYLLRELFQLRHMALIFDTLKLVISEWRSVDEKGSEAPSIQSNLEDVAAGMIMGGSKITARDLNLEAMYIGQNVYSHIKHLEVVVEASCCQAFSTELSGLSVELETGPGTLVDSALGFLEDITAEGRKGFSFLSIAQSRQYVDTAHPTYQLRCDLVRLIGNLAFKNKAVQDQVRKFGSGRKSGLITILDQAVIDERNPFLLEWTKLALSNLLRDNEENAQFMHSLQQQQGGGQTNGADLLLRGCGLVLERDGNRVKIRAEGPQPSLQQLTANQPSKYSTANPAPHDRPRH